MALPTVVFASGSQDKTETTSGKVTKKTATQQLDEENQKTVSVKGKVATQANEEQIVISKVDVIFKITDEMERVLKNGGYIPKEYNTGKGNSPDDYTTTIPNIMDIKFSDEHDNVVYSMEQLNEKLKKNNATLKIRYGWLRDATGQSYEESIALNNTVYYLNIGVKIIDNSNKYLTVSNGAVALGSADNYAINVYIAKKNKESKIDIKESKGNSSYRYSTFELGNRNQIVALKNIALHNHSWEYKQDTQTTNKILAYCTQTEYKDGCSYQGKDHALTLNLDASDMEYTGKEYNKASVTNNISSITGATCGEIYYKGTNYKKSTTPPTNPGTYTASVTLGGVTATKNFTIAKVKVSAPSISSKEYTGEIQTADIKETPLYEVKENKGGTEAGSYDVVLSLKDAANYTWETTEEKELKVSFIITRTSNTWKTEPSVKGWTYGESHEAPVAEPMYGKDTLVVEYRPADAEDSAYTTEEPKDAGDYKVRFTVAETESYGSLSKVLEFTIAKAKVSAPSISSKEYTGKIQTADIKETPLYEVKENKGGTEAGSYDVVLSLKDAANYTWETTEEKELKVSFIITRTSNTWKTEPSVKGWTYGESHEAPVAEPMYGKDTLVVEYRPADAEDSAYTTEEPKDAGDYKVRFTVAETESYGSLSKVLEFTIQKAAKEAPKVTAVPEDRKRTGQWTDYRCGFFHGIP